MSKSSVTATQDQVSADTARASGVERNAAVRSSFLSSNRNSKVSDTINASKGTYLARVIPGAFARRSLDLGAAAKGALSAAGLGGTELGKSCGAWGAQEDVVLTLRR